MPFTEKPPNPLPPSVRRYDEKGRPLPVLVAYEKALTEFLIRLAASIA
ncbi:MAG: hypothetical protein JOZ30_11615 [Hyphomicrobiales bacterium]|nr:hypothetical protein [Hyphomicrobiales bacterium]